MNWGGLTNNFSPKACLRFFFLLTEREKPIGAHEMDDIEKIALNRVIGFMSTLKEGGVGF